MAEHRCPAPEANAICPRSRSTRALAQLIQRSGLRRRPARLQGLCRTRRPAGWPAPRPACVSARRAGSAVSSTERSSNAAAAASPPRACARPGRPLQLRGHLLVRPGRGLSPVPGPAVRIGDRDRSPRPAPVHCQPVGQRRRPVGRRPQQRMPEPHPGAELRPARPAPPAPPPRPGWPSSPAARHTSDRVPGRIGRRQLQQPPGLAAAGPPAGGRSCPRSGPAAVRRRAARTRPPAPPGVSPRGSSSSASGLPPVSATIRSRTRTSSGPASASSSSTRASSVLQPADGQLGQPGQARVWLAGARTPAPPGRRPAAARRTPAPAPRPGPATARRRSGRSAAVPRPPPTAGPAQPARPGTGPGQAPLLRPNAVRSCIAAAVPAAGRDGSSIGAHSWCSPAKASSISDCTPDGARHPAPCARPGQVVQQRGLAHPRLTAHHQGPALTGPDRHRPAGRARRARRDPVCQPRRAVRPPRIPCHRPVLCRVRDMNRRGETRPGTTPRGRRLPGARKDANHTASSRLDHRAPA